MPTRPVRQLIALWLGWLVILLGFQWVSTRRLGDVARPDYAVSWSAAETRPRANTGKVYLENPFLNRQLAWDSEYYLSIAVGGYDDPAAERSRDPATGITWSRNYNFFPAYPYLMRAVAAPLALLGLAPIDRAALAGVLLSLLGTLAGMLALRDMTRAYLDDQDALRAAFYLLVFPSAVFLAQVYSEGLFIGLAFWSLALSRRGKWLGAGLLAALAAWTRAHGGLLVIPLGVAWLQTLDRKRLHTAFSAASLAQAVSALLPLAAHVAWRTSNLGHGWAALQSFYYVRGVLTVQSSLDSWLQGYRYATTVGAGMVYFALEVVSVIAALLCSVALLRKDPPVASFSLAVVVFSALSGSAQGQARYMLVAPALFIVLAMLGRSTLFDRVWTMASVLMMGLSALLFSFDMWVG